MKGISQHFEKLGKQEATKGIGSATFELITTRATSDLLTVSAGSLILLDRLVKSSTEWTKDTSGIESVLKDVKKYQSAVIKEALEVEKEIEKEIKEIEKEIEVSKKEIKENMEAYHDTKHIKYQREAKDLNNVIRSKRDEISGLESGINEITRVIKVTSKAVGVLSGLKEANQTALTNKELTAIVKDLQAKIKKLEGKK